MEDKTPTSNKGEKNEKNSFFPFITKSEMQNLISHFKDVFSNFQKNKLQEFNNEESQIINNKSNTEHDDIKSDEISNTQLVKYEFANSKGFNWLIYAYIYNIHFSIFLPDLRKENYLIELVGINYLNNYLAFNLYDNIWIKESFIFSNFMKNKINIEFDFSKNLKLFWNLFNLYLMSFKRNRSSEIVREYFSLKNNTIDSDDEKLNLLRLNKTKLELKKFKFYFDQLMNEINALQTNENSKREEEFSDKNINEFEQNFIDEENWDNYLLIIKTYNFYSLNKKESNKRKYTFDDNRSKCFDGGNTDNTIRIDDSLDSLFDEIEEKKIEEHLPFIIKMDNFFNQHYQEELE